MNEIEFSQLALSVQNALKFIAAAAVGGMIGNRTDAWFMSLFYHQRRNLIRWLSDWNPSLEDLQSLSENERVRLLLSKVVHDISNEINEEKLLLWPIITDSIVRNANIPFDNKQYYSSLYNRFDAFTIKYLATLYSKGPLKYNEVFESQAHLIPEIDTQKRMYWLGQMQCSTTGLTVIAQGGSRLALTDLGKEFIDFISNKSSEKLQELTG